MKPFDEYDVRVNEGLGDLIICVNADIGDGWEPLGGVVVATALDGSPRFLQAIMRKYKDAQ